MLLLALLAGQAGPRPAEAGAWTLREGEGLAIATLASSSAEGAFGAPRADPLVPALRKTEIDLLLEAGLSDDTTLIARPQYGAVELGPPVDARRRGLAYSELGLRRLLWKSDDVVLSAQLLARLPGARDEANPAAGGTGPELDLRLLVGRSFELFGRPAFADAEIAYRARPGDPAGEARADFTLGVRPRERILLLVQSFNVASDGSAAEPFEDTRYHKLQLSVVWEFAANWSVQLGAVATVSGRSAPRERGVIAALWRRF